MAVCTGCQNKLYYPSFSAFYAIFEDPDEKMMPHSQINCQSWLNNVNSELFFLSFEINSMVAWKKVSFKFSENFFFHAAKVFI